MAQDVQERFVCSANFTAVKFCKAGPEYVDRAVPAAVFAVVSLFTLVLWILYVAWDFGFLEDKGAPGRVDPRNSADLDEAEQQDTQCDSAPQMGVLLEFQNPQHEQEFRDWIFPLHRGHLLFAFATALPGFPLAFILVVTLVSTLGEFSRARGVVA